MSLELFTIPTADLARQGYRMVKYSPSTTGIRPITDPIANDDIPTTAGWLHDAVQPLKTASRRFRGNQTVTFLIKPHLESFHTGRLLTPGVEMVLELFCNAPDFFTFGTKTSGAGAKRIVTLSQEDLKVSLHLCRVSLIPRCTARCRPIEKASDRRPSTRW